MSEYGPEAAGDGRYLVAFIESAGEVSPVFERKLREMASERFETLSEEEWYRLDDMKSLYEEVHEEVGDATMRQGGIENAKAIPWPDEVTTIEDGLQMLNNMHKDATRGSDEEFPAGRYTFEMTAARSLRFGVTEAFPWPSPFVEGAVTGLIQDLGPGDAAPTLEETTPDANEKAAWNVTW